MNISDMDLCREREPLDFIVKLQIQKGLKTKFSNNNSFNIGNWNMGIGKESRCAALELSAKYKIWREKKKFILFFYFGILLEVGVIFTTKYCHSLDYLFSSTKASLVLLHF